MFLRLFPRNQEYRSGSDVPHGSGLAPYARIVNRNPAYCSRALHDVSSRRDHAIDAEALHSAALIRAATQDSAHIVTVRLQALPDWTLQAFPTCCLLSQRYVAFLGIA